MAPTSTLERGPVIITEPMRAEAETLVQRASDARLGEFRLVIDGQDFALGESLSSLLAQVVSCAASDGHITFTVMPDELTTTVAAHELGVSRPTLMKMIRTGEIPAHKVGSHHRILFQDLVEARERQRDKMRAAIERLRAFEDEIGDN